MVLGRGLANSSYFRGTCAAKHTVARPPSSRDRNLELSWNLQQSHASQGRNMQAYSRVKTRFFNQVRPDSCRALGFAAVLLCAPLFGQQSAPKPPIPGVVKAGASSSCEESSQTESKRIFGIVPNYRTSPCLQNYKPLTTKAKFKIATQDSFDRGTFVLAAAFAGEAQLTN